VLGIVLGVFLTARHLGHNDDNARGLTFAALVVANVGLILTNRSWTRTIVGMMRVRNTALWWVVGGVAVVLPLILSVPFLRTLFRFAPPHPSDLMICLIAGAVSVAWFELLKLVLAYHRRGSGPWARTTS